MSTSNTEIITITVSEYLSADLARKIAMAQWKNPEWSDSVRFWLYQCKTETDCFNVTAQNEFGDVIGRLFCIQNDSNPKLWYYGDLFVLPEYRRRHIAEKMIFAAIDTLKNRGSETIRCYVEPDNTPSLDLQRKLKFKEKPFLTFNNLINDGEIMFEKELGSVYEVITAQSSDDARYITRFYAKNEKALHGKEITHDEWCKMLSERDTDEENFLICRGAMPVAWLKINGLVNTDTGYISMLAVEPCFQHKGIGTFAIKFAVDFLLSKGKQKIGVQTTEDNALALSLYKKCGFVEVEKYTAIAEDNSEVIKVKLIKNMQQEQPHMTLIN